MTAPRCQVVYGVVPEMPAGDLVVDYDARRIGIVTGQPTRCAELADLAAEGAASLSSICLNLLPFSPKAQWQRDIGAAAILLRGDGTLTVRASERRLLPAVRRVLDAAFTSVERSGPVAFRCRGSKGAGSVPDERRRIVYRDPVSARAIELVTSPGLFSGNEVDPGTLFLLRILGERRGHLGGLSVLDVGCGYGALGCTLAARGATVTMIDSDWRAVKLARAAVAANGLTAAVVLGDASADLPPGPFDLVVSNPPTHAGSAVLRTLFHNAARRGRGVAIVVLERLNYEKWLREGYQVETWATGEGYKVLHFTAGS
jgi:16S rRNA G1207 methylase RsmC